MSTRKAKISIITVCYNAERFIERTIRSVEAQDYADIEYIVVDGQSTDRTLEIVRLHQSTVSQCLSEPDKGIYDAMNKGLRMATGDYVWFMNAGDELYDSTTARRVAEAIGDAQSDTRADVVYGHAMVTADDGSEIGLRRLAPPERLDWTSFRDGMLVSHQSFVARRAICPAYDTAYHFSADFDWCVAVLQKSTNVVNSHQTLCRFLDGGFTKSHIPEGLRERFGIMCKRYGVASTVWHHIPIAFKFFRFWITKGWF